MDHLLVLISGRRQPRGKKTQRIPRLTMLGCLVVDNFSDCSFYQHIALVLSIAEAADGSVMCIHGNDYLIMEIEHSRVLGNNLNTISKRCITTLEVGEPSRYQCGQRSLNLLFDKAHELQPSRTVGETPGDFPQHVRVPVNAAQQRLFNSQAKARHIHDVG